MHGVVKRGHRLQQLIPVLRQHKIAPRHLARKQEHDSGFQVASIGGVITHDIVQIDRDHSRAWTDQELRTPGQHLEFSTGVSHASVQVLQQQLLTAIALHPTIGALYVFMVQEGGHVGQFRHRFELGQLRFLNKACFKQQIAYFIPGTAIPPLGRIALDQPAFIQGSVHFGDDPAPPASGAFFGIGGIGHADDAVQYLPGIAFVWRVAGRGINAHGREHADDPVTLGGDRKPRAQLDIEQVPAMLGAVLQHNAHDLVLTIRRQTVAQQGDLTLHRETFVHPRHER